MPLSIKFVSVTAALVLLSAGDAHAGLKKWFKKEVVPTITGERPLRIKPEISIQHGEKIRLQLGPNSAYINIGGVTVKTNQLQLRLQQAGCVLETGGNVIQCAPDIVQREGKPLADLIVTALVGPSTLRDHRSVDGRPGTGAPCADSRVDAASRAGRGRLGLPGAV